jgi:hypothetical protein
MELEITKASLFSGTYILVGGKGRCLPVPRYLPPTVPVPVPEVPVPRYLPGSGRYGRFG